MALPPQALASQAAPEGQPSPPAYYESTGVRKATVLARYMDSVGALASRIR